MGGSDYITRKQSFNSEISQLSKTEGPGAKEEDKSVKGKEKLLGRDISSLKESAPLREAPSEVKMDNITKLKFIKLNSEMLLSRSKLADTKKFVKENSLSSKFTPSTETTNIVKNVKVQSGELKGKQQSRKPSRPPPPPPPSDLTSKGQDEPKVNSEKKSDTAPSIPVKTEVLNQDKKTEGRDKPKVNSEKSSFKEGGKEKIDDTILNWSGDVSKINLAKKNSVEKEFSNLKAILVKLGPQDSLVIKDGRLENVKGGAKNPDDPVFSKEAFTKILDIVKNAQHHGISTDSLPQKGKVGFLMTMMRSYAGNLDSLQKKIAASKETIKNSTNNQDKIDMGNSIVTAQKKIASTKEFLGFINDNVSKAMDYTQQETFTKSVKEAEKEFSGQLKEGEKQIATFSRESNKIIGAIKNKQLKSEFSELRNQIREDGKSRLNEFSKLKSKFPFAGLESSYDKAISLKKGESPSFEDVAKMTPKMTDIYFKGIVSGEHKVMSDTYIPSFVEALREKVVKNDIFPGMGLAFSNIGGGGLSEEQKAGNLNKVKENFNKLSENEALDVNNTTTLMVTQYANRAAKPYLYFDSFLKLLKLTGKG